MAASFQQKIGEILKGKLEKIMDLQKEKSINISQVALVGGVAANKCIYEILKKELFNYNCELILPPKKMLSDNAAMIGWACIQKYSKSNYSDILFKENPRLTI